MLFNLNFGNITFFENYAICEINEGETISIEKNRIIIEAALDYYKGNPFCFIVNREHSYSVDPMIYKEVSKIDTLKYIAVTSTDSRIMESCQIEKLFSTKPFELFSGLNQAIEWINENMRLNYPNSSSSSIAS